MAATSMRIPGKHQTPLKTLNRGNNFLRSHRTANTEMFQGHSFRGVDRILFSGEDRYIALHGLGLEWQCQLRESSFRERNSKPALGDTRRCGGIVRIARGQRVVVRMPKAIGVLLPRPEGQQFC
ncbi:Protein of unknown function [Gryllus bimaculatus]|nr:Protein of unknown function [Gryllus bimaculatus]